MEFTPIDICANSVIKLIQYPNKENRIFHLFDHNHVYIVDTINTIRKYTSFNIVSNDEFIAKFDNMLDEKDSNQLLAGILRDFNADKKLVYESKTKIKSDFTIKYLQKIGFVWPKIDENYLSRFIEYFHSIGYINWEEKK